VYTIENSFTSTGLTFTSANDGTLAKSPVKLTKIASLANTDADKWSQTQLVFDDHGRYMHTGSTLGTPTNFASYIIVSPL
jgi:hypothetical protein